MWLQEYNPDVDLGSIKPRSKSVIPKEFTEKLTPHDGISTRRNFYSSCQAFEKFKRIIEQNYTKEYKTDPFLEISASDNTGQHYFLMHFVSKVASPGVLNLRQ